MKESRFNNELYTNHQSGKLTGLVRALTETIQYSKKKSSQIADGGKASSCSDMFRPVDQYLPVILGKDEFFVLLFITSKSEGSNRYVFPF